MWGNGTIPFLWHVKCFTIHFQFLFFGGGFFTFLLDIYFTTMVLFRRCIVLTCPVFYESMVFLEFNLIPFGWACSFKVSNDVF